MKTKIKKVLIITLIIMMISPMTFQVFAVNIGDKPYLQRGENGYLSVQYYNKDHWTYIVHNIVTYDDGTGTKRVAYCVVPNMPGIEWLDGNKEGYNVNITELLSDVELWRVYRNGYPYKTSEDLGVETDGDAYLATKLAGQCIIQDRPLNEIRTFYRAGQAPVAGQKLEDIQRRGNKIIDAVYKLVKNARNSNETPANNSIINISKVGSFESDKNNCYSQTYKVTSETEMASYTVRNILGFPNGSYSADLNGNAKTTFNANEQFKIMMPKDSITSNINGKIIIDTKCKTYPVFFGEGPAGYQDYAVCADPYADLSKTVATNLEVCNSSLKIYKTDKETGAKLSGVKFNVKYKDGTNIGDFTTNKDGVITVKNLKQGTVIVKELKTQNEYVLDASEKEVSIGVNTDSSVTITNMHKKGNLTILKVDKDDNDITLGGVEFDLIDSNGKVIKHLVTDVNGRIEVENLNTGTYTLRETKTKKEYNLAVDKDLTITWKKTAEVKVENEKKKGQIKIIKVDADYNEVKLEGVEFQIIDKNNHIVETIKTDKNGEASTSRLPIGDYKIKESSLGRNEEYILNDEVKVITVEENKIKTIKFENERKKGNLKIYKVDLDNNKIPVSDVEFVVTDQDGYKYKAISDENGIVYIENIRTGSATIKETKTNKIYKLSEETYNSEINWNETTEITIQNEKLKGQIEVFKVDSENNEIKLEGVEFQVINSNDEVVETITTNKDGYAITSRIPIGEYKLKEVKTDEMHILNEDIVKVDVTTDIISKLNITNDRIKGQIKVIKTSQDDNFINETKAGTPIPNVKFEVYDSNKKLVGEIITDKDGIAITEKLDKGTYAIKEVESGEWYLLNENEFSAEIKTHGEIVEVNITNESEKSSVDIEKTGIIQTTANQEIKYDFKIKNAGNVPLDKFTWYDYLPTEYVRITKLVTGTYNQDLDYSIYYKTNKNDYRLLKEKLNTQVNNYIDFSNLELQDGEYVTEFKADFGTVDVGFESVINPYIFVRVNSNVENDDVFTNKTRIEGYNKIYMVWDEDDHTTKVYEKELKVKKLPRTGE